MSPQQKNGFSQTVVRPLFKKGGRGLVRNYRPVSLTCGSIFTSLLRGSRYLQYSQRCLRVTGQMNTLEKPVENAIKKKLTDAFNPAVLEVKNESRMHKVPKDRHRQTVQLQMRHYSISSGPTLFATNPAILRPNVGSKLYMFKLQNKNGSETHFKVLVVTDKFESIPLIKRHRMVNETLQEELNSGVHALSIVAKTPTQWEESEGKVSRTPVCQGGFGS